MRTSLALVAAMRVARDAADTMTAAQTIALNTLDGALVVLPSQEYAVLREGAADGSYTPLLSIFPDGRVDLYSTALPREVSDVH